MSNLFRGGGDKASKPHLTDISRVTITPEASPEGVSKPPWLQTIPKHSSIRSDNTYYYSPWLIHLTSQAWPSTWKRGQGLLCASSMPTYFRRGNSPEKAKAGHLFDLVYNQNIQLPTTDLSIQLQNCGGKSPGWQSLNTGGIHRCRLLGCLEILRSLWEVRQHNSTRSDWKGGIVWAHRPPYDCWGSNSTSQD